MVIPALDEEASVALVVKALPPVAEVVVVDNGSRDRTAEVARAAGARVVEEPRRGYGSACLAGIAAAPDAEIYAFADADFSDHPEQLARVLAPLERGEADLVIGSRQLGRRAPGAHPWHAIAGTRLSVALMNLLVGSRATDLGPLRAIRADALRRLGMRDRNFGWTVEMQVKAARAGLRVAEVPVDYRPRIGRSKVSGTLAGSAQAGVKIVWTILRHGVARRSLLVPAALALSACVARWALQGDQTGRVAGHLGSWLVAFAAYLVALHAADGISARGMRIALALALGWRLALVAAPPLLTDDVYRYVWEGRIQLHGGNPYAWDDRPEAEKWMALRDETWRLVNHKDYTAIYPPLFQLAARAVVALHDSVLAMKVFAVACEIAALALLARLVAIHGLPRERLLVWAWSPLALVEIAGSGHNDAAGLVLLVAALLALAARPPRAGLSALAIAGAALVKFLPALVGLAWWRRYGPRHVALALAAAALVAWPFAGAGSGLWLSLSRYSQHWLFNETLFAPLAWALGHDQAVRAGALLGLLLALGLGAVRAEPASAGLAVAAAFLLLTPNLLPWYALWLLPFLVLRPAPALLLLTGTVALAYLVYPGWQSGERWQLGWAIRALEYGPCLGVALVQAARAGRWRRSAAAS